MSSFEPEPISYCTEHLETKCAEHIQSLIPPSSESKAFRDLAAASLTLEASWSSLIIRYIYRYLHTHDLYQVSKSNVEVFSELVSLLSSNGGLPDTEEVIRKMVTRCKSLIDTSAQAWANQGLLIVKGKTLQKSTVFKEVWEAQAHRCQVGDISSPRSGTVDRKHNGGPKEDQDLADHAFVIAAAERVKAAGRQKQKRPQISCPENCTKRVRRGEPRTHGNDIGNSDIQILRQDCTEIVSCQTGGNAGCDSSSVVNSDARDCIVIGEGEISYKEMELRYSTNTLSEPLIVDQPSEKNPTTAQQQNRIPTPSQVETATIPLPTIHSLPSPSESVNNKEGTVYNAQEALLILEALEKPRHECRASPDGTPTSMERECTDPAELLSARSTSFTHQENHLINHHTSEQPQSDSHSDVVSSVATKIPVTYLLNGTPSSTKIAHLPQSTISKTASSAQPSSDTQSTNLQNGTSGGPQVPTQSLMSSRSGNSNMPTSIAAPPAAPLPRHQAYPSKASDLTLSRGSDSDFSGVRNDEPHLEENGEATPSSNPRKNAKRKFSNRTKTGCMTCRRRKKKCDEARPECNNCRSNGYVCTRYQHLVQWPGTEPKQPPISLQPKPEYKNSPYTPQPAPYPSPQYLNRRRGEPLAGYRSQTLGVDPPYEFPSASAASPKLDQLPTISYSQQTSTLVTALSNAYPDRQLKNAYECVGPLHDNTRQEQRQDSTSGTSQSDSPSLPLIRHLQMHSKTAHWSPQVAAQFHLSNLASTTSLGTQKEEMLAGRHYFPSDKELGLERERCNGACWRFNSGSNPNNGVSPEERARLFRDILQPSERVISPTQASPVASTGRVSDNVTVQAPFNCDYGYNISIGQDVTIGKNCTILDTCEVKIGDRCSIGPNVKIYTATLPVDPKRRLGSRGPNLGRKITIDSDCWIGGGVTILPGRTIGKGSTVGAGSIVTKDVPPYTVVCGNPARVICGLYPTPEA